MSDRAPVSPEIDALLKEDRAFPPSEAFRQNAHVRDAGVYEEAARDPEAIGAPLRTSGASNGMDLPVGARRAVDVVGGNAPGEERVRKGAALAA